ncbi:hypothetical protein PSN45_000245 [Yamadazyma tenuis]|uniref:Uncharacterized protein n=1 Tax=Candida tenuis (strain ATCC 10573 / BCRC 21748 / CBS 615 / JCM 9827 / NBRC 10315 / NRRL Y-1498 / VKM Y-70) TaxID=590646 RepID=G3BBL5_CANTC|nr:uncharacterized protein CANTEDRAFT_115034 [Yamadazyma tenuis ATCC 10573]XP_006688737.1 uncharacterized protein CANTEDRAFT_115034 [Yamadazyma tenuis ATCC 10573]EGV62566.1 hypothetical protein CANTEDRAFT_115034 [Yamadazyma tenuis ATCC 10573]EGV62567.1 hypothetical protein CANTEDRAFT_115034 [Yamadazyma tenuis ATCC 10573]WEJ92789.1 hypothetical protein PSN45_000245 [Yamadazyma tenuis]
MPPKLVDKRKQVTILKFKRGKSTYVVPIEFSTKSFQTLQNRLLDIINNSGGLTLSEDEPMMEDEDDIKVPKSEFIDEEEETGETDIKDAIMKDSPPPQTRIVKAGELAIGLPRDKTSPYSNDWVTVDDTILSTIEFNDYDILAFAVDGEPFNVVEAAYEE